jgi:hypothetical protein|uniref:Uncharacterized protein n=1 Tax=viral metagenome TaxID=1070528 RepID=A0A6C0HEN4_9ZZZZ
MDKQQIFMIICVISVCLLVLGAIFVAQGKWDKSKGCDLNRKLSLDDKIVPSVAQFEYDMCQKSADLMLKWSTPLLVFGAIATAVCAVIIGTIYIKEKRNL